jgi:transcriptional regulator with XRE-family HTH domain
MSTLKMHWEVYKKATGTTQVDAAKTLGWTQSAFSQYINGKIPLNFNAAVAFSQLFNVPIWELDSRFLLLKQLHREALLREI